MRPGGYLLGIISREENKKIKFLQVLLWWVSPSQQGLLEMPAGQGRAEGRLIGEHPASLSITLAP
jgi:hypothetical protein